MIDTDKYEGHTEGPWEWTKHSGENQLWGKNIVIDGGWSDCENCGRIKSSFWDYADVGDMKLIADAPLLLEAYEELLTLYRRETRLLKKMEKQYRELKDIVRDPTDNYPHNAVKAQLEVSWKHYTDLRVLDAKHGSHATFIKQYEELKEALIGDSPNWTHDEVVQQALELATLNHNDGERE